MKNTCIIITLALCMVTAFIVGCETSSASKSVVIHPSSTTIRYGQSIEFHAEGGYDYAWSLSDESLGTLSSRTGEYVTYTSLYSGGGTNGNTASQTLTVTSTIAGTSGSTTNSDSYSVVSTAIISHI